MTMPIEPGTGGQGNPAAGAGNQGQQGNQPPAQGGGGQGNGNDDAAAQALAGLIGRGNGGTQGNSGTSGTSGTGNTGSGSGGSAGSGSSGAQPNTWEDLGIDPDTLDPAVRTAFEAQMGRANNLQQRARTLERERNAGNAAQRRLQEIENERLSETERATARAVQAEKDRDQARSEMARVMAAANNDLPPELVDLLGDGDTEAITERAVALRTAIDTAVAAQVQNMINQNGGRPQSGNGGLPGVGGNGQRQIFPGMRPVASLRAGGAPSAGNGEGQPSGDPLRDMIRRD